LKLSKRLKAIEQLVTPDYAHIWDCCCDHGSLGMSLLAHQAAPNIHFVDIVPQLMTQVENTLVQFFANSPSHWQTYCLDVAKLPLEKHEGRHLVIIAGVGGDLMIEFINRIHETHPTLAIDFLLCPVHHQYALRERLIALNFSLKNEVLIKDNNRFYEVMLVSSIKDTAKKVHAVGEDIWQSTTESQAHVTQQYLKKTLNHYQRIEQGKTTNVEHIIAAYSAVIID